MSPETASRGETLAFAQAGVSFASALALVALDALDDWLWWSTLAFAIAIPVALCHAMLCHDWSRVPYSTPGWRFVTKLFGASTNFLTLGGVVLMLYHVSATHALAFGASILVGVLVWFRQSALLRRVQSGRLQPTPGQAEQ